MMKSCSTINAAFFELIINLLMTRAVTTRCSESK